MKKLSAILLSLLLVLSLVACATQKNVRLDAEYEPYTIPWQLDAIENAKTAG